MNATWKQSECPDSSPWGKVQDKRELAAGIWSVSTAGHGGIKLSCERNRAMPEYMRAKGGWYEEDCQWSLVALVFPLAFQRIGWDKQNPERTEFDLARDYARNWYADEYESFYGVELTPAESRQRAEQAFQRDHANDYVVISAINAENGMVSCTASIGGIRSGYCNGIERRVAVRHFSVPRDEYSAISNQFGFVVDLSRHAEIMESAQ